MEIIYNSDIHNIGYVETTKRFGNPLKISIIGNFEPVYTYLSSINRSLKYRLDKLPDFTTINDAINSQLKTGDFRLEDIFEIDKREDGSYIFGIVIKYSHYTSIVYTPFYSTMVPLFDKWDRIPSGGEVPLYDIMYIDDIHTRSTGLGYRLLNHEFSFIGNEKPDIYIKKHILRRVDITIKEIPRDRRNMVHRINNVIIQPVYDDECKSLLIESCPIKNPVKCPVKKSVIDKNPVIQLPLDMIRYILLNDINIIPSFINTNKRYFSLLWDPSFLNSLVTEFKKRGDFPYWFCNPIVIRDWMKVSFREHMNRLIKICNDMDIKIREKITELGLSDHKSIKYMITGGTAVKHFYNKEWSSDIDIWYPRQYSMVKRMEFETMDFVPDYRSFSTVLAGFDISLCQIGYTSDKRMLISPAFLHSFLNKEGLIFVYFDNARHITFRDLEIDPNVLETWEKLNTTARSVHTYDIYKTFNRYKKYQERKLVNSYCIAPRKYLGYDVGDAYDFTDNDGYG